VALLLLWGNLSVMPHLIAPSLLSADFANLQQACEMINASEADWFHLDIMDGEFVPNITFGMPVIAAILKHADKPFDVHLMIVKPERYIQAFRDSGADILTVHYEACPHLHRTIFAIKEAGMKAGVAINPHTPADALEMVIADIDLVCVMSVNPGFGGQKFINATYSKVQRLKEMIAQSGSKALIEIDGGVSMSNARQLIDAGANVLVAGNFVFSSPDPIATIKNLKNA